MPKILFSFFFASLIITAVGCDKNDDEPTPIPMSSFSDIDIVTGLNLHDANGVPLGRWRSPSDNRGNGEAFPNPSVGQVALFSETPINKIWLVPAECLHDTTTADIPGMSNMLTYPISEVIEQAIESTSLVNSHQQVILDYSGVTTGFYRLFYTLDENPPHWQNLFIDPNVNNIPSLDRLDDLCD